jgi:uncharacterized protein (DUF4415 family)
MKRTSTSKRSVRSDDAPKVTQADIDRAEFLVAGKKVSKAEWQKAARLQLGSVAGKKRISIMLDAAVIEHFKAAAGERGYQTLINETLRQAVSGQSYVSELRSVLRQELAAYKLK